MSDLAILNEQDQQGVIAIAENSNTTALVKVQKFVGLLHKQPDREAIDATSDGKAKTVLISHIETTLDELFFGLWSTENFKWAAIANEVQGSLELVAKHPITGDWIRRTGAASIIIQVDKVPDDLKDNPREKNLWALNPENKKQNALDLGFPKLKAECLKNAAQSFGPKFGRDLNRKQGKTDTYNPLFKGDILPSLKPADVEKIIEAGKAGRMDEVNAALAINFDQSQKDFIKQQLNIAA